MNAQHSWNGGVPARHDNTRSPLDQVRDQVGHHYYDPTTLLSCAAWTDAGFRDAVLAERKEQHHRTPAREPGLDAEAVVGQCRKARNARAAAGRSFIGLSVGMCVLNLPVGAIGLVLSLCLVWRGRFGGKGTGRSSGRYRGRSTLAILLFCVVAAAFLSQLFFVWPFVWFGPFAGPGLYPSSTVAPGTAGFLIPLRDALSLALLLAVLGGALARFRTVNALGDLLWPKSRDEAEAWNRQRRVDSTVPVALYSSFMPFVGAGVPLEPWPYTLRLHPEGADGSSKHGDARGHGWSNGSVDPRTGGRNPRPAAATGTQLVEAVYARLRSGLPEITREMPLPTAPHSGLMIADCVFLPGKRVQLPQGLTVGEDGPLDPWWAHRFVDVSHERARHFLEIRLNLWEGQLVVTAFVRVTSRGGLLHIEGETLVMPPIADRYGVPIRKLPRARSVAGFLSALWGAALGLPGDLRDNLAEVGARARMRQHARQHDDAQKWAAGNSRFFDYSPRRGVREIAATDKIEQLFQSHDARRVATEIQEKVLLCVREVLAAQGYSTGEVTRIVQHIYAHNVGVGTTNFLQRADPAGSPGGKEGTKA